MIYELFRAAIEVLMVKLIEIEADSKFRVDVYGVNLQRYCVFHINCKAISNIDSMPKILTFEC